MAAIELPAEHHLPLVAAYLDARLALAEAVLERAVDPAAAARIVDPRPALAAAIEAAAAAGVDLPDAQLARRHGLSPAAIDLLWLCAAPALDPTLLAVLRRFDGTARDWVDMALAGRALAASRADRQALYADLAVDAPLRRAGLVRIPPIELPGRRELVPATWLPAALRGRRAVGARLEGLATLVTPSITLDDVPLPERAGELVQFLAGVGDVEPEARFDRTGLDHPRGVAVLVQGRAGSGRGVLVRAVAGHLGRRLLVVDAARLRGANPAVIVEAIDAAAAEAAAGGELLVITDAHEWIAAINGAGTALSAAVARALTAHAVVAVLQVIDDAALAPELEQLVVYRYEHVVRPQHIDAAHLWLLNLPATVALDADLDLDAFARSINLTPAQVRAAARAAVAAAGPGRPLTLPIVDAAARGQLTQTIGSLAELQASTVSLDDLVLRPDARNQLEQIISAARNRDLVLRRWGLRRTIKRGLGITCLFDGTPGTGKTLSAEVIAHELGLSLLRINVASIVDKYIGETEKNLTRIFEQARPDTTMLLFDEADSLFTKRTEVQHASDRFSNMNVNVLLQLVERFEGTAVLTTNLKKGLDNAFGAADRVQDPLRAPRGARARADLAADAAAVGADR
ncbi:MAG: AAA family ATPase [Myxococcales bacterium]|nr:AAA family ATPase [Myxococcales bacterium]